MYEDCSETRTDLLFNIMKGRNAIAVCLQETWRSGFELLKNENYKLISSGLDKNAQLGKRGSQGVAILLNPDGVDARKQLVTKNTLISVHVSLASASFFRILRGETSVFF